MEAMCSRLENAKLIPKQSPKFWIWEAAWCLFYWCTCGLFINNHGKVSDGWILLYLYAFCWYDYYTLSNGYWV